MRFDLQSTSKQGTRFTKTLVDDKMNDSHTEVRDTARYEGVGVDVLVTRQKWKEEESTALLYGVLLDDHIDSKS